MMLDPRSVGSSHHHKECAGVAQSRQPVEIELITLRYPCTACHILANLQEDVLRAVQRTAELAVQRTVLDSPAQARSVPGLEVERFPALIIDGEQVTCGELMGRRELLEWIQGGT